MALASSNSSLSSLLHRSQSSAEEDRWPLHGYVASGIELLDDRDLITLVKGDDQGKRQEALTAIFNKHCDDLQRYFLEKGIGSAAADDLWAETWTRAFDKICGGAYQYQGKPIRNYLFRIAKFVFLEHYGREKDERMGLKEAQLNQQQQEREKWNASWMGEDDDPPEVDPSIARDRELHEALTVLSPKVRDIILLTYFGGMNSKDVAAEMGMKDDAVRQNLSRAYKALRGLLGS